MSGELHIDNQQLQYIARISHGKDSMKMLDVIVSRGLRLDRITTTDVWATDTIRGEYPEMVKFKEMADEYIGYVDALDQVDDWLCGYPYVVESDEAEPVKHSQWKYYYKQGKAVCMNCSFERNLDDNFGRAVSCPNCGAKMDEEEECH